jgi:hypothetical protein
MSRSEDERSLGAAVSAALRRFLDAARRAVMGPGAPDPNRIYGLQPQWNGEVDTILTHIGRIAIGAWSSVPDAPPVSRHAFLQAYLADVQNLLVRIPDEVANLVFAEISEGTNAGESRDQIAARVDKVLRFTGSERWPNRAKVIAQTEVNRAYGAATMAAGVEQARVTGRQLTKRWDSKDDDRVRSPHRAVDGQVVPVWSPFYVEGVSMMFPGDPSAPPELVINCRCQLHIGNEVSRG